MTIFPLIALLENAEPTLANYRRDRTDDFRHAPVPMGDVEDKVAEEINQLKLKANDAADGQLPNEVLDFLGQLDYSRESDAYYAVSSDSDGTSAYVIPALAMAAYKRSTAKRF